MDYTGKISRQVAGIPRSGIRDFFELVQGRDDVISLGVGEPDFATPWHIREAAIYSLEKGHTSYTSNLGLMSLRKEISRYANDFFHIDYDAASEILITVGVSEAIDLALRALIDPGDEVIYLDPFFVMYPALVQMCGGIPVPVDSYPDFRLDPAKIEAAVTPRTKMILLNSPANPTGVTATAAELKQVAELAGSSKACRAVGNIMGKNPLPLVIP